MLYVITIQFEKKKQFEKNPSYVSNTDAGITPKYHEPNVLWFSVFGWIEFSVY